LKDEEAMDWCKKIFEAFIGQGEQAQGMSLRLAKGERSSWVWKKEKEEENEVGEGLLVLVCGGC